MRVRLTPRQRVEGSEGRRVGRLEGWKVGRLEGWKVGGAKALTWAEISKGPVVGRSAGNVKLNCKHYQAYMMSASSSIDVADLSGGAGGANEGTGAVAAR